ncbi:MAG: hypothetical protein KAV87_09700 [Desulfobacteraceae bacterium]|nr:hypothetical protein [Desulfobacteraceae bacterium]
MDGFTENCPTCYWFETNGLEGEDAAMACRSPKWEWAVEELDEMRRRAEDRGMAVLQEGIPEFVPEKHCDFKPLVDGKSYVDIEYGPVEKSGA